MKNAFLLPRVQNDIDIRVGKIHRELGDPTPPLRLEDVFELLRLNRGYFASSDDGLMQRAMSRLKIAGKQVLLRPTLIKDAVLKFDLKAFYVPDRKRILIDESVPRLKHRWLEAHEVIHDILEWHRAAMFGDTDQTTRPSCHEKIENEANYGAGQLLFFGPRFGEEARDSAIGIATLKNLHKTYGNTMTTTLWRFIELAWPDLPMVGIVSVHPHPAKRPGDFDPSIPCKHCIQSPRFAERFSSVTESDLFDSVSSYCGRQRGGPLGEAEIDLTDDNGDRHRFYFETFYNGHDALTLGRWVKKASVAVGI